MYIKKLILVLLFLSFCISSFASHKIDLENNSVYINGEKVLEFRVNALGETPQDRASILVFNLINLNNNNLLNSNNISIKDKTEEIPYCIININNVPLINVTEEDAKCLNSTPMGLAKTWANNLKQALKKIPIYMLESEINIPLGEIRIRNIYGYNLTNITVMVENPNICTAQYNDNNTIQIMGTNLGSTYVTISNGQDEAKLKVNIKKYAADLPDEVNLQVSGNPFPSSMIYDFVNRNVVNKITTEPLANTLVNDIIVNKKALYPGNKICAKVKLTCYGDDYISVSKTVNFNIENTNIKTLSPSKLHYSNNPETIEQFGDVYLGALEPNSCHRLLYHHMNKTGEKAKLIMEVINTSKDDIDLRVMRGAAKPIVDTIAIGVVAGKEFTQTYDSNITCFDTIPAYSRTCYLCDSLKNLYSSSGIMEFTQLNGPENLTLRIKLSDEADINLYETRPYLGTGKFVYSDFIFNNPIKEYNEKYIVGKQYVFMPLGKNYIENDKHLKLYGNYGVSYTYNIECENPTDKVQKCRVYLDPSAGSMAAFIKINNEYKTIHHVKPPNEYNLLVFSLNPNEKKNITINTIPLSGSNYPAKIVVGKSN